MNLGLKLSLINDSKHCLISEIWGADLGLTSIKIIQSSISRQRPHFLNFRSSTLVEFESQSILRDVSLRSYPNNLRANFYISIMVQV